MRLSRLVRSCLLLLLLSIPARRALAQATTGRIVGRVVDASKGQPVAGAQVEVVGAEIRAVTALDGRYTLEKVPQKL